MGIAVQQVAEGFDTLALHAGAVADPTTGALLTPIYQTTTYRQEAVGKDKGFTYSRSANPTVRRSNGAWPRSKALITVPVMRLVSPPRRYCVWRCCAQAITSLLLKPSTAEPCGCSIKCLLLMESRRSLSTRRTKQPYTRP